MKPLMFVPPAQAEVLSDTQDELREDCLRDDGLNDRVTRQPWRDDDGSDDAISYNLASQIAGGSAGNNSGNGKFFRH
jgi:hypothetical protein